MSTIDPGVTGRGPQTSDGPIQYVRRQELRKFFPYSNRHIDRLIAQNIIPRPAMVLPTGVELWDKTQLDAVIEAYKAAAADPSSVVLSDAVRGRMAFNKAQRRNKHGRFAVTSKRKTKTTIKTKTTKTARKSAARPKKRAAAGADLVVTT
jgi:hypothetical protein